jgi:tRNA (guanine-N7-)-methyltransferase
MTSDSPTQAPASVAFPKNIKSFVKRAGRTTTGQAKAFEVWGPQYLLSYAPEPLNMAKAFALNGQASTSAPVILEIGFGMGEATAHIAKVRPQDHFLCCEVHEPGVGALLKTNWRARHSKHPHFATRCG